MPRIGAEYVGDGWAARGGYSFRPTPAPTPKSRANILDGDTHTISLGGSLKFDLTPRSRDIVHEVVVPQGKAYISVDLTTSIGIMPMTKVHKDGTQPVLNDYEFGGYFFNGLLSVTLGF